MLPKIFVLLTMALSPDGQLMNTAQMFDSEQSCVAAAQQMMKGVDMPEGETAVVVCMETPWVVKGARGA